MKIKDFIVCLFTLCGFYSVACASEVTLRDLKKGDVIVYMRHVLQEHYHPNLDSLPYCDLHTKTDTEFEPYVDHLTLFSNVDDKGNIEIAHSTPLSFDENNPHRPNGLCVTFLKNKIEFDEEIKRYVYFTYDVIRHDNEDIATKALEVLLKQATFRVPYDPTRLQWKEQKEEEWSDCDFTQYAMSEFDYTTLVKFIIRNMKCSPWTAHHPSKPNKGITCSMAVILAYNTASTEPSHELLKNFIMENISAWPTRKINVAPGFVHIPHDILNEEQKSEFIQKTALPLEPKYAGAGGVVYFMLHNEHSGFRKIGTLSDIAPPIVDKKSYNEKRATESVLAAELRTKLSPHSSPSSSPISFGNVTPKGACRPAFTKKNQ